MIGDLRLALYFTSLVFGDKVILMQIQTQMTLAPLTTYQVGGPARYYSEAQDYPTLVELLEWAKGRHLPVFILGGGSNILVSDEGFGGLVIKFKGSSQQIVYEDKEVIDIFVGAGTELDRLVQQTVEGGQQGLEWASGIPGVIGGALKINASAFGGQVKDNILEIRTYDPDKEIVKKYDSQSSLYGYKDTIFLKEAQKEVILGAKMRFYKKDPAALKRRRQQILFYRAQKHPSQPSCGSVFKNVTDRQFIQIFLEQRPQWREKYAQVWQNKIPAGLLIDEAGLKGFQIGAARVSEKHANFIVNQGTAKADEILQLISLVKERVQDQFGVSLQNEVRLVGF